MGCWGVYDDQTDGALDTIGEIEDKFYKEKGKDGCNNFVDFMNYASNFLKEEYSSFCPSSIVGLSLCLVNYFNKGPEFNRKGNDRLPKELPIGFPEYLRKETCRALDIMINNKLVFIDIYEKNREEREQVVLRMIELFNKKPKKSYGYLEKKINKLEDKIKSYKERYNISDSEGEESEESEDEESLDEEEEYKDKDSSNPYNPQMVNKLEPSEPPKPSGFLKPVSLSKELEEFLGLETGTKMARTEVTKRIADYIREHDLKNLENPRQFYPDEKLKELLGDPVYPIVKDNPDELGYTYFNLQKYLIKHFIKTEE